MWVISAVSLFIVMTCCVFGVFSPRYIFNDNLLQRLGMTGLFFFCLPRFIMLVEQMRLTAVCMPAPAQVLGHVGLALFCLGTAWHVIKKRCAIRKRLRMI